MLAIVIKLGMNKLITRFQDVPEGSEPEAYYGLKSSNYELSYALFTMV